MRVLVTGGAGFIGSHTAEHYARKQDEVIIIDNLSREELLGKSIGDPLYNWNHLSRNYTMRMIKGDIRKPEVVKEVAKNADLIVHTAAQVAVTTSLTDPVTDFQVNAMGTLNILEAARQNDSTVVYCSTNKVYGNNVNRIPVVQDHMRYRFSNEKYRNGVPEEFPIDLCGHTPYGCSKLAADLYTQDYGHTYGMKTGVFRMSCVYGERQFGVEDQGWVAWFTIAVLREKPITIYGDGMQVRDVLHVSDLVTVFDLFAMSKFHTEVFNIGGGVLNSISILELIDLLRSKSRCIPRLSFSGWREGDQRVYISDISKAEARLGWRPRVSIREGIDRVTRWITNSGQAFV